MIKPRKPTNAQESLSFSGSIENAASLLISSLGNKGKQIKSVTGLWNGTWLTAKENDTIQDVIDRYELEVAAKVARGAVFGGEVASGGKGKGGGVKK